MTAIRYDERRAGERGLPAGTPTGTGWSAIRAALEAEADHLRVAAAIEAQISALSSVLKPHAIDAMRRNARAERAAARAAVARFVPPVSTFEGEPVPVHPDQLMLV